MLTGFAEIAVNDFSGQPFNRRVRLRPVLLSAYCLIFSFAHLALLFMLRKKYLSGGQRNDVSK